MAVWDLGKRKAFLVHQVVRLTDMPKALAETKSLAELEKIEKDFYEEKHPALKGQHDYKPSSL